MKIALTIVVICVCLIIGLAWLICKAGQEIADAIISEEDED